jgi:hypothetical protein
MFARRPAHLRSGPRKTCQRGRAQAWSTRRAFPLCQGGRAASRLAPRARRARCASLSTRRRQRRSGVRTRAASKPCKQHAFCIADHQVVTSAEPTMDARVPRTCQNSCFHIMIDPLHAEDYLQHICWTRRRHDIEQSILSFAGMDQQQLHPSHLWTNAARSTPYTTYNDPRDKRRGHRKCINASGGLGDGKDGRHGVSVRETVGF